MNNLRRVISPGTVVLVDRDAYTDPRGEFICENGFGLKPYTFGTGIYGKWVSDGTDGRIEGTDIISIKEAASNSEGSASD